MSSTRHHLYSLHPWTKHLAAGSLPSVGLRMHSCWWCFPWLAWLLREQFDQITRVINVLASALSTSILTVVNNYIWIETLHVSFQKAFTLCKPEYHVFKIVAWKNHAASDRMRTQQHLWLTCTERLCIRVLRPEACYSNLARAIFLIKKHRTGEGR